MDWRAQAFSFIGVLGLVAITRALGLGRRGPLTDAETRDAAAAAFLPARPDRSFVSNDGRAAVVAADDGRLCLVKRHGTHPATRLLTRPVAHRWDGDAIVIDPGERMFGEVRLTLPQAERDSLLRLM